MSEETDKLRAYHRLSMHRPGRPPPSPGSLDWKNQPDPFRRFADAPLFDLPRPGGGSDDGPALAALDRPADLPRQPLSPASLSRFLELSLGLTAWKQVGNNRWALRANPSSGNLHPSEGYVILPPIEDAGDEAGLHHYAPERHALEKRARIVQGELSAGGFLFGLSAIPWRESWKYGERALRYCLLDAGHVLGTISYAAATLGWRARLVAEISDGELARLLGLDEADQSAPGEPEVAEFLARIELAKDEPANQAVKIGPPRGRPNRLSSAHRDWPEMVAARLALSKPQTDPPPSPPPAALLGPPPKTPGAARQAAREVIRQRRSATGMDPRMHMARGPFLRMLGRCVPDPQTVPWNGFPYPPRIALAVFVHRVRGVAPGLYLLGRDEARRAALGQAMDKPFQWKAVDGCSALHLLAPGDHRRLARGLACGQEIAGDGVFSVAMIADFAATLEAEGAWAYRRLHWEAGLLGQILYLEAVGAGLSATGIGAFFDQETHAFLGLDRKSDAWQCLYQLSVGAAVPDRRLATLPAYHHLAADRDAL